MVQPPYGRKVRRRVGSKSGTTGTSSPRWVGGWVDRSVGG